MSRVKTPLSSSDEREKTRVFRGYCGVYKFDEVVLPRVIPKAEEANVVLRRSHPWTVRPRQWHVARGGPTIEKEIWKGG